MSGSKTAKQFLFHFLAQSLRLVAFVALLVALWFLARDRFGLVVDRFYRLDHATEVAYPVSDAGNDFLNGVAIATGDGWVNWRDFTRWTVYKPGWSAYLGWLARSRDFDTARMQTTLTSLYAMIGPAMFLLLMSGRRNRTPGLVALALCGAVLFLLFPQSGSWAFATTMNTETPTLLLSMAFCALVLSANAERRWPIGLGLLAGLAAAAVVLIRDQSRYGVALALVLVLLRAIERPRLRLPMAAAAIGVIVCIVAPFLIKTSIHLDAPYTGTSYTSLRAVLQYSKLGQEVGGGAKLSPEEMKDEATAIGVFRERAGKVIASRLVEPDKTMAEGWLAFERVQFKPMQRIIGTGGDSRTAVWVLRALCAAGLLYALGEFGLLALVPLAFGIGYFAPCVGFSYYMGRFGEPISWIGWVYVIWGVQAITHPWTGHIRSHRTELRRGRMFRRSTMESIRRAIPSRGRVLTGLAAVLLVCGVTAGATSWLLNFDGIPYRRLDAAGLLADERAKAALERAGIPITPELEEAIRKADESAQVVDSVEVGQAVFPIVVKPGDPPLKYAWGTLNATGEIHTSFMLVHPWKQAGKFASRGDAKLAGEFPRDFRHGDRVIVIHDKSSTARPARAVLLAKWAEGDQRTKGVSRSKSGR